MKAYMLSMIALFILLQIVCLEIRAGEIEPQQNLFEISSKPYTRYWWFASEIKKEDVKWNLDWLKENGFGGVEIAWVYPLNRNNKNDTSYTKRYDWLSPEWQEIVNYTIIYADSIGLGCDLTFGTLWPFGDSYVKFDEATQKYGDKNWRQKITASWEYPKEGYVIDHLTPDNYIPYFNRLLEKFPRPRVKNKQAYFIDSWEVETEKLWCEDFDEDFDDKFGYDISDYMNSIYENGNEGRLFDYMSLISEKVLKFYSDYTLQLNNVGILSRGQVSGAPCDLISGYAKMDIPEGEAMLYEPEFNSIPASAALLSGKKTVSAESFTCIYGWPRDYIREEQTADLKLLADALFANGINHIIWHGKAHNAAELDSVNFYASSHLGYSGNLFDELKEFNKYLEKVSSYMKKGYNYSQVAVYLPTEDSWRKGIMPKEKQFKWAWGYYEMRYIYLPDEVKAYSPAWINSEFISKAIFDGSKMLIGDAKFDFLYIDVEFMDYQALLSIEKLAAKGLPIVMKRLPKSPNYMEQKDYNKIANKILSYDNVTNEISNQFKPIIQSKIELPAFHIRKDGEVLYIFFPNPKSYRLKFPLIYGQSFNEEIFGYEININYEGKSHYLKLNIEPYQSLLYKLENGKLEQFDINFTPKVPVIKERPQGFVAPWLVK